MDLCWVLGVDVGVVVLVFSGSFILWLWLCVLIGCYIEAGGSCME